MEIIVLVILGLASGFVGALLALNYKTASMETTIDDVVRAQLNTQHTVKNMQLLMNAYEEHITNVNKAIKKEHAATWTGINNLWAYADRIAGDLKAVTEPESEPETVMVNCQDGPAKQKRKKKPEQKPEEVKNDAES